MFPGYCVCDLTKDLLDAYILTMKDLSPKSRNHRRAITKQFLRWCVAKDYLNPSHRLLEAIELKPEALIGENIDYYLPSELRALLENAEPEMRVIIALQAFAGLRLEEALRLEFSDLFRRIGHIEISSAKSKTRQHRLRSFRRFSSGLILFDRWKANSTRNGPDRTAMIAYFVFSGNL